MGKEAKQTCNGRRGDIRPAPDGRWRCGANQKVAKNASHRGGDERDEHDAKEVESTLDSSHSATQRKGKDTEKVEDGQEQTFNSEFRCDLPCLPLRDPELNPCENVWQDLPGKWLSNSVFESFDEVIDVA
jgi:hypothetical protein